MTKLKRCNPKMMALIEEWLASNVTLSESSKDVYRDHLNKVFRFTKEDLLKFDSDQMNAFIGWLRNTRKHRSETIKCAIKITKRFLRWTEKRGLRTKIIWDLQRIPNDESRATAFSYSQYLKVLDAALNREDGFNFWPSAIIIGWNTGLRISDVISLKWAQVDLENAVLRPAPLKRQNVRQVLEIPMDPELRDHLQMIWTNREERQMRDPHVLRGMAFIRAQYPTCKQLRYQFNEIVKEAGLASGYTFKSFRHAFVTRLLNAGVDARIIGSMTGQSIKTVYHYVRAVELPAKVNALAKARQALNESRMLAMDIQLPHYE